MITPLAEAVAALLPALDSRRSPTETGLVIDELDRWTNPRVTTVPDLCFCYCRVEYPAAEMSVR